MPATVRLLLAVALLAGFAAPARAQSYQGQDLVKADLLLDPAAASGKPLTVGVRLRMAKDWHTYWRNSGDFGLPTEIDWVLPPGWTAGPILWPLPHRMTDGDIITFGYSDEVLLLTELTPPAGTTALPDPVTIRAKVSWLVCRESCVPGDADLTLTPSGAIPAAELRALFEGARGALPLLYDGGKAGFTVTRTIDAKGITFEFDGLLARDATEIDFYPLPPNAETSVTAAKISATARGTRARIEFAQPPKNPGVNGVIAFTKGGRRLGWEFTSASFAGTPAPPSVSAPATADAASPAAQTSLFTALWLGLLGGLILNVMPCVLPVLSLKLFSFLSQAGAAPRRVFHLGLAYSAGVFTWFLGLAGALILLNQTWGAQFQNPWFLLGLSAVVFVFALNLLGVFEIILPGQMQNSLVGATQHEGFGGAFFQGLLATVLATSCTAPFLGAAVGFTLGRPAPIVLLVFAAVALGMASPMLLLTAFPGWMKFLPRPGAWMERVKQLTGFLLIATVLFLLWVVGQMRGVDAVIWAAALMLTLGLAAWIYGSFVTPVAPSRTRLISLTAIALVLLGPGGFCVAQIAASDKPAGAGSLAEAGGIPWEKFSAERLDAALAARQPVFIDFTADWCVNCKFNERTVLETDVIRAAFREKGFLALKGDWTRSDPAITAVLRRHQRAGIPLYLVYAPGKSEPQVLPELLTKQMVLDALTRAAPAKSSTQVAAAERPAAGR